MIIRYKPIICFACYEDNRAQGILKPSPYEKPQIKARIAYWYTSRYCMPFPAAKGFLLKFSNEYPIVCIHFKILKWPKMGSQQSCLTHAGLQHSLRFPAKASLKQRWQPIMLPLKKEHKLLLVEEYCHRKSAGGKGIQAVLAAWAEKTLRLDKIATQSTVSSALCDVHKLLNPFDSRREVSKCNGCWQILHLKKALYR